MNRRSDAILTADDMTTPRSPTELAQWVERTCRAIAADDSSKKAALLHQGMFKKFYEEIFPLSHFLSKVYAGRPDIECIPNLGNEDFDAIIIDHTTSPPSKQKIEITSAAENHEEHLRMKFFVQHGHVSVWGPLSASGTERTGHEIQVENEVISHRDLLQRTLSSIKSAAEGKSAKPNGLPRYGQEHILIIAFDDWNWFRNEDEERFRQVVPHTIAQLSLDFGVIYLVGLSGKTCLRFDLTSTQGNLIRK